MDKVFEALSSAPRRRILAYLSKTDMTAGEIAQRFTEVMSQPSISKHLSLLENAGLVWREKRGQNVYYGLKSDTLTGTLVGFMSEVCPEGRSLRRESVEIANRRQAKKGD
ncbi:MAG TPA: metalloregulator ArsR/SmtB family transcription factor [Terriglobales bacterium]|nr:metalloregulator ArsR/SmtB family transcription factor [Terriglobales bacterium]